MSFDAPTLPRKGQKSTLSTFRYEGFDLISLSKIVEREYTIPTPQTAEEVIGYYARRIAQEVKLPSQFASIVPKVRLFLAERAFGEHVDLTSVDIVQSIGSNVAHYVTVKLFSDALKKVALEVKTPELGPNTFTLSATRPFPWSKMTTKSAKSIFNLVACDNLLEKDFSRFLHGANDVAAFSKIPEALGFTIEYVDAGGGLRLYEPDFVVRLTSGACYIVETKGREDVGVALKDRAATLWCSNVTDLTYQEWKYLKVNEGEFRTLKPDDFAELLFLPGSSSGT